MSFTGALTQLNAQLVTVGAALSPRITYIRQGEITGVLQPSIGYWYDGDQESTTGGRTLTKNNVQEKVTIRVYWPMPSRDDIPAAALDASVRAANRAIQASLWGNADLDQTDVIGIAIDGTSAGWVQWGEAFVRQLTIPLLIDMAEVETIGL